MVFRLYDKWIISKSSLFISNLGTIQVEITTVAAIKHQHTQSTFLHYTTQSSVSNHSSLVLDINRSVSRKDFSKLRSNYISILTPSNLRGTHLLDGTVDESTPAHGQLTWYLLRILAARNYGLRPLQRSPFPFLQSGISGFGRNNFHEPTIARI